MTAIIAAGTALLEVTVKVTLGYPSYGVRRITASLSRSEIIMNRKMDIPTRESCYSCMEEKCHKTYYHEVDHYNIRETRPFLTLGNSLYLV